MNTSITVDRLAALVRGEPVATADLTEEDPVAFCAMAEAHGVVPLVAARLAASGAPESLREIVERQAADHVAADLLREADLRDLLAALAARGVRALVMKGSHLAYSHYPRPDLRARTDTDVLIREADRAAAEETLRGLGYVLNLSMSGDLVMPQRTYVRRRLGVASHLVDLHWKVANPQAFGGMLTFDELWPAAVPLPALGSSARGLSPVHALLLAAVHRVAHHEDSDCLVWLYDIHLVAGAFDARDWAAFVDLAADRGVAGICRVSLTRAAARFETPVPPAVLAELGTRAAAGSEPSAAYLKPRRRITVLADDVRLLPTWTARLRLLREHVFPPPAYMREVYAPASAAPLPVLYATRVARGARKWLTRS